MATLESFIELGFFQNLFLWSKPEEQSRIFWQTIHFALRYHRAS